MERNGRLGRTLWLARIYRVWVENLHVQTLDQAQTGKEFCLVSGRKEIKLGMLFIWGRGHVF